MRYAIRKAAAWLSQAVRRFLAWVLSIYARATAPRVDPRRPLGFKLPPGASIAYISKGNPPYRNPLRQFRRMMEQRMPELKSGRQWKKWRKELKRKGVDWKVMARLDQAIRARGGV